MPRVYIAGPSVFFTDAAKEGEIFRAVAARHGLSTVYPLDAAPVDNRRAKFGTVAAAIAYGDDEAARIEQSCYAHMDSCAAVIADITPFRGPSADVGTALEIGYMRGCGKPRFLWSLQAGTSYADRVELDRMIVQDRDHGPIALEHVDVNGMLIENFGLTDNLMVALAPSDGVVHGTFPDACKAAADFLNGAQKVKLPGEEAAP